MGKDFAFAGTWSHATLREEDLLPAFIQGFYDMNTPGKVPSNWHAYLGKVKAIEARMEEGGDQYWESEDVGYDLEEMFDLLNDIAPEGYYFGAIEGDGSDFGYWAVESTED